MVHQRPSVLDAARIKPVSARDAARILYDLIEPDKAAVEKARRRLRELEQAGKLVELPKAAHNDPTTWGVTP